MMAAALIVTAGALLVIVEVGRLLEEGARAATAADAAALAGAAEGRDGAASIAVANGAALVSYTEEVSGEGISHALTVSGEATLGAVGGSDIEDSSVLVTVTVRVGRATRSARAEGVTEWTAPE